MLISPVESSSDWPCRKHQAWPIAFTPCGGEIVQSAQRAPGCWTPCVSGFHVAPMQKHPARLTDGAPKVTFRFDSGARALALEGRVLVGLDLGTLEAGAGREAVLRSRRRISVAG